MVHLSTSGRDVGYFSTDEVKMESGSEQEYSRTNVTKQMAEKSKKVEFEPSSFRSAPTVLVGLNMIDCSSAQPLKLAAATEDVSAKGFTLRMDVESKWACNASYIAMGS